MKAQRNVDGVCVKRKVRHISVDVTMLSEKFVKFNAP